MGQLRHTPSCGWTLGDDQSSQRSFRGNADESARVSPKIPCCLRGVSVKARPRSRIRNPGPGSALDLGGSTSTPRTARPRRTRTASTRASSSASNEQTASSPGCCVHPLILDRTSDHVAEPANPPQRWCCPCPSRASPGPPPPLLSAPATTMPPPIITIAGRRRRRQRGRPRANPRPPHTF